jgi:thiol-disulfide isomerase/thioredoxin
MAKTALAVLRPRPLSEATNMPRFYTALGKRPWQLGLALLAVVASTAVPALEPRSLAIGGVDIPLLVAPAQGTRLVLWLPPEDGPAARQLPSARALAKAGVEVWMPDLHAGWFLAPGSYSLADVPPESIATLIDAAAMTGKEVYLLAGGRAGQLALAATRAWQLRPSPQGRLGGVILMYPKLYGRTPQGGEDASFAPIVRATSVPVFLMQPDNSSGWWRIADVAAALGNAGAAVYVQKLAGVSDGFEVRDQTRVGEPEMTARLPAMIANALALLDAAGPTPLADLPAGEPVLTAGQEPATDLLRPVREPFPAPPLALADLAGRRAELAALRGQVVLVNFWATWCPPCVEEIPSLDRLQAQLASRGFTVLAVDVGEDAATVSRFLADKPVRFPVLLDPEGEAFKAWKAYAFPTSVVLDRHHRARYAVYGAFAWDGPEVIAKIDRLLEEP